MAVPGQPRLEFQYQMKACMQLCISDRY